MDEVPDHSQNHFKGLKQEYIQHDLLPCKQLDGEPFSNYYTLLENLAEEVFLCSSNHVTCAET